MVLFLQKIFILWEKNWTSRYFRLVLCVTLPNKTFDARTSDSLVPPTSLFFRFVQNKHIRLFRFFAQR